jgi:prepilin-type N-terminal cleavage/methylation domain-containing protein
MKQSLKNSRAQGFTLVELLVVIAIIAILAAVVTVAAGGVINSAKRAKAGVACNQIVTAITSYYTDYGVYPVESGNVGDEYYATQDDWDKLTIALCGNINPYTSQTNQPSTVPNARATIYLTVQHSDVDNTGALKTPFTAGNAPEYYYAEVDSDYSNTIGGDGHIPDFSNVTSSSTSLSFDATLTTGAAAWSNCDAPYGTTTTPSHWVHTY